MSKCSSSYTITVLNDGTPGGTVIEQYALMVGSARPSSSDFQDSRPSGWYVGCVYWRRLKIVNSDGSQTFSEAEVDNTASEVMQSMVSFSIQCNCTTYPKDLRSNDPVSIIFKAVSNHYLGPSFSWEINGSAYTGSTVTLNYTKATVPVSIVASCTLSSAVAGHTYTAQASAIQTHAVDITRYNLNLGILSAEPSGLFVDGDSYALQSGGDYLPYVYNHGTWVPIEDASYWPDQIAQIRDTILANGIDIPRTSSVLYAYIGNLSAQQAQIDKLSTSQIVLQNGGELRSANYAEDEHGNPSAGFKIDHNGSSSFVGSKVVNSVVSGSFTSKPLETQEETAGSEITGVFSSTEEYNDSDVYRAIDGHAPASEITELSSGTHTYGSDMISGVLKLIDDSQRTVSRTAGERTDINDGSVYSALIPVQCGNCSVWGTPIEKRLQTLAYDGVRKSQLQFSLNNSTWTSFEASRGNIPRSAGQRIYVRQLLDTSQVDVGSIHIWNTRAVPLDCDVVLATEDTILIAGTGAIHKSTDGGFSWIQVWSGSGKVTGLAYGNGVFVATSSDFGILRSTDALSWTNVSPQGIGWNAVYVAFGGGKFRTSAASGNIRYAYESTDGQSWSAISGEYLSGHVAYGNGIWVHTRSIYKKISFIQGQFITVESHGDGTIQSSTDGILWATRCILDDLYESSQIIFAKDRYLLFKQDQSGSAKCILSSISLSAWTDAIEPSASTPGCCYTGGRIIFIGSGIQQYCPYARYTDADWTLTETGTLGIGYDYSAFPLGINLLGTNNGLLATITNDNTSWRTQKTVISSWAVNPAPYCHFSAFMQNGAAIESFDARRYTEGTLFRIIFTKYGGSSVNLVSPSSGSHQYNIKWNSFTFVVMLNGATVASFDCSDHFAAARALQFTPVGQLDAILVKDVIPKEDSAYALGAPGREFISAHIETVYGHLAGSAEVSDKLGPDDFAYAKVQGSEMNFQNMNVVKFGYRTYGGESHVQDWVFNQGQAAGSHAYFDYCHGAVFN